jgi:hypothetical protein
MTIRGIFWATGRCPNFSGLKILKIFFSDGAMGRGLSPLQLFMLRRCAEVGYCLRQDVVGLYFGLPVKLKSTFSRGEWREGVVKPYSKLTVKEAKFHGRSFGEGLFDIRHPRYDSISVSYSRSKCRLIRRGYLQHVFVTFDYDANISFPGYRLTPAGVTFCKQKFANVLKPAITLEHERFEYITVKGAVKVAQGKPIVLTVKAKEKLPEGKPLAVTVKGRAKLPHGKPLGKKN